MLADPIIILKVNPQQQQHQHPILGYAFFIDCGAISWRSRKQELVTLYSGGACLAMHAAKEAIWLCKLLTEFFPIFSP